jgi:hypothetical protein
MKDIYFIIGSIIVLIFLYIISTNKVNSIVSRIISKIKLINFIKSNLDKTSEKLIIFPHLELGDNIIFNGIVRHYCSIYKKVILICKVTYVKQLEYMYNDLNNLILYPIKGGEIENINVLDELYYDNEIKNIFIDYNIKFIAINSYKKYYDTNNDNLKGYINKLYYGKDKITEYPLIFFNELNLPYDIRYTNFKVNRNYIIENEIYVKLINILGYKYNIIIDDEKRNFNINIKYIKNNYPNFRLGNNSINLDKELENIKTDNIFNYIKILENAQEIHTIDSSIVLLIDALNLNVKTYIHRYLRPAPVIYNNKNFLYIR